MPQKSAIKRCRRQENLRAGQLKRKRATALIVAGHAKCDAPPQSTASPRPGQWNCNIDRKPVVLSHFRFLLKSRRLHWVNRRFGDRQHHPRPDHAVVQHEASEWPASDQKIAEGVNFGGRWMFHRAILSRACSPGEAESLAADRRGTLPALFQGGTPGRQWASPRLQCR